MPFDAGWWKNYDGACIYALRPLLAEFWAQIHSLAFFVPDLTSDHRITWDLKFGYQSQRLVTADVLVFFFCEALAQIGAKRRRVLSSSYGVESRYVWRGVRPRKTVKKTILGTRQDKYNLHSRCRYGIPASSLKCVAELDGLNQGYELQKKKTKASFEN